MHTDGFGVRKKTRSPNQLTPYERLLRKFVRFYDAVRYPETHTLAMYHRDDLEARRSFCLSDLRAQVNLACKLGYEAKIISTESGMAVQLVKRPEIPSIIG